MTTKTEGERLAIVETKINIVIDQQKEVMKKMDEILIAQPTYVTIEKHQLDLAQLQRKNSLQVFLTSTLAAAFGAMMTILIQSYFGG